MFSHCLWFSSIALFFTLVGSTVHASVQQPFPNPFTLEQALSMLDESHPNIAIAQAAVHNADAQRLKTNALLGTNIYADVAINSIQISNTDEALNDSYVRLMLSKTIYDFGYTRDLNLVTQAQFTSNNYLLQSSRNKHKLEIVARYYEVVLADQRYIFDNEEMTVNFLRYDKLRERHRLGMYSDLELLQAENAYRIAQIQRVKSNKAIKSTRLRLALTLNRTDDIPEELATPSQLSIPKVTIDSETLYKIALKSNLLVLALEKEVTSAQIKRDAVGRQIRPTINVEFEAGQYERTLLGRNDLRVGVTLRLPLLDGGKASAFRAEASADLVVKQAQLRRVNLRLLNNITQLVHRLEELQIEKQRVEQQIIWRDLNLDKQRTLYEMEVNASMGDGMAKITEAEWLKTKNQFEITLTIARINVILNRPLFQKLEGISL